MRDLKTELADYYGELIDEDIEQAIEAVKKEPIKPSKKFRKQMAELIRTGKPNNGSGSSKRLRRFILIAAAALLILSAAACAVPKVHESIAGFFVKVFSDHDDYFDPAITKEKLEEEYELTLIPEGFSVIGAEKTEKFSVVVYQDGARNAITMIQAAKGFKGESVDNEHGTFVERTIGDKTVRMHVADDRVHAAWIYDGYYFSLAYTSYVDPEVFASWIDSVRKK